MLAGIVYFYNENDLLIKEIDIEEYEELSKEEFQILIDEIAAFTVTLDAYYHNHHSGKVSILYEKDKKQT